MNIYVVQNFCSCRLCGGSTRVTTVLDREAFLASHKEGMKSVMVGGRNPRLVIFPEDMLYVGQVSAAGKVTIHDTVKDEYLHLGLCGEMVFSCKDSVHGCSKIVENQGFRLYLRPFCYGEEVNIIYTREGQER